MKWDIFFSSIPYFNFIANLLKSYQNGFHSRQQILGGERNSAEIRSILILCNAMLQINTFLMQSHSNCFPKADFIWETLCKFCNTRCKFARISARKYITAKFGVFCVFSSFINSNAQIIILKFYRKYLDILDVFVIKLKKYIQIYNPLHYVNEMCLCLDWKIPTIFVVKHKLSQHRWMRKGWERYGLFTNFIIQMNSSSENDKLTEKFKT